MQTLRNISAILMCVFLVACGGDSADSRADAGDARAVTKPVDSKKAPDNPLASQQQLIKDAKGIQDILDTDAEKKKKALKSAN